MCVPPFRIPRELVRQRHSVFATFALGLFLIVFVVTRLYTKYIFAGESSEIVSTYVSFMKRDI